MKCTYEIINLAEDVIDEKCENYIRKVYDSMCESISKMLNISEILDFEEQVRIFDMAMESNAKAYLEYLNESEELNGTEVNYYSDSKDIVFLFGEDEGSLVIKFDLSE